MGFLASSIASLIPERKSAIGATVPTWQNGVEQSSPVGSSYERNAREGYMLDEIVYDCIEYRANAAGEPPMCAYSTSSDEKIEDHPALTLLNKPNRFMGRARFWGTILMSLDIGGNAYVEKVRSDAGKVVELWPLRPDRVRVIPSASNYVGGYTYTIGGRPYFLPAEDVIHYKTRHPLDDYYGLPPLAVLAGRVDLDVWARQFTAAFFRNAGVPAGLLTFTAAMTASEKDDVRRSFRELYGGANVGRVMVLEENAATYTPMGLPLGNSGLAMPELNQITETRIIGAFGLFVSLIPSMAGIVANRGQTAAVSDREAFWEGTMVPKMREVDTTTTMGLADEYPDLDRVEHDLSKVKALQEDEDKKHTRWRENWKAGLCTWQEARARIGEPEEPDEPGVVLVATTMTPTPSDQMIHMDPLPQDQMLPPGAAPMQPQPVLNGSVNGTTLPTGGRTNGNGTH